MFRAQTPIVLGAVLLASAAIAGQSPPRPPNVLLVITDDQGYGDLGVHGNPHLRTPFLDRFAAESVRFETFYVHPFCSPTRAALLTGRYPLRTGVWSVTGDRETMRAEEWTLPEALRAAGYRTGCFGKWHNGMQFPYTPRGQGFEEFFGFCGGHWNSYFDAVLEHNGRPVQTRGYIADELTDAAVRFIRAHRDEPFFCYVPYNTPHSPDQAPRERFDAYKAMGLDDHTAAAYAMCENLDGNFARLLGALDELGLADDTIVLFLTDNGLNGQRYNAGMRGTKGSVHEGGCRVPLFIRWPGRFQPRTVRGLAAHIDLYPTVLDLCGIDPHTAHRGDAIDGKSLRPLLEGHAPAWPRRMLFTHSGLPGWDKPFPAAVRTERFRAVRERGAWQLYDMQADPAQEHDVAAQHPDQVQRIAQAYERWYADVSSAGWRRPPIPVGHPEANPVELLATQARFDKPIRFFASRAGFANDWLTGWTDDRAKVHFDLDVVTPGRYRLTLRYTGPEPGVEVRVRASTGEGSAVEAGVPPAEPRDVPLPSLNPADKLYHQRIWATAELGALALESGEQTLTLEGGRIDLKSLVLERLDPEPSLP